MSLGNDNSYEIEQIFSNVISDKNKQIISQYVGTTADVAVRQMFYACPITD